MLELRSAEPEQHLRQQMVLQGYVEDGRGRRLVGPDFLMLLSAHLHICQKMLVLALNLFFLNVSRTEFGYQERPKVPLTTLVFHKANS